MSERPSFLQVDRWALERDRAQLDTLGPEWDDHLRELERDLPAPAWVHELQNPPPQRRRWWWTIGVIATVALVLFVVAPRDHYVGVKGSPDVELYLAGGLWQGEPIAVGTAFRVVLRGPEAPYYAIALEENGMSTLISAGPWPADGAVPGAWAFDAPPTSDAALLVLRLPIDPQGRPLEVLRDAAVDVRREPLVIRKN